MHGRDSRVMMVITGIRAEEEETWQMGIKEDIHVCISCAGHCGKYSFF